MEVQLQSRPTYIRTKEMGSRAPGGQQSLGSFWVAAEDSGPPLKASFTAAISHPPECHKEDGVSRTSAVTHLGSC